MEKSWKIFREKCRNPARYICYFVEHTPYRCSVNCGYIVIRNSITCQFNSQPSRVSRVRRFPLDSPSACISNTIPPCPSETRDLQIGNFLFESNHELNQRLRFEFESNLESNQGVVVYVFNAVCHRSCVGLLRTTGNYPTACYVVM